MAGSKQSYYLFTNPNPNQLRCGDCVVRALSLATHQTWDETFSDLCTLGYQLKRMPNDREVYRTYLHNAGFVRTPISNKKGSKRPTVSCFAKEHPTGTYILEVAHHVVTVENGKYLDIWDCGNKCLYGYLSKPNVS